MQEVTEAAPLPKTTAHYGTHKQGTKFLAMSTLIPGAIVLLEVVRWSPSGKYVEVKRQDGVTCWCEAPEILEVIP